MLQVPNSRIYIDISTRKTLYSYVRQWRGASESGLNGRSGPRLISLAHPTRPLQQKRSLMRGDRFWLPHPLHTFSPTYKNFFFQFYSSTPHGCAQWYEAKKLKKRKARKKKKRKNFTTLFGEPEVVVVCSKDHHSSMEIFVHAQPALLESNDISSHMPNLQPKGQDLRWRKEYQELEAHCKGEWFSWMATGK